jgi:antitoxin component YwqK of YwqJK toxin-antitoxin module
LIVAERWSKHVRRTALTALIVSIATTTYGQQDGWESLLPDEHSILLVGPQERIAEREVLSDEISDVPLDRTDELIEDAEAVVKAERPESIPTAENLQTHVIRDRDANGRVIVERTVVESSSGDFINHGSFTSFDGDGKPSRTGTYELGRPTGEWTQFVSQQQIAPLLMVAEKGFQAPFFSTATFREGELDGEWIVIDASQKRVIQWSFADGVRQGQSIWYSVKGEPAYVVTYTDNVPHGPAQLLSRESGKLESVSFDHGRLRKKIETHYDGNKKSQKKSEEWQLVPSTLTVLAHDWMANSVTYLEATSQASVRDGVLRTWYPNGQLGHQGEYENGEPKGEFLWWYATGQLQIQGSYSDGVQNGDWTWWHENGMKKVQGTFVQGRREGVWSQWKASGELIARGSGEAFSAQEETVADQQRSTTMRPVNSADLRSQPSRHRRAR